MSRLTGIFDEPIKNHIKTYEDVRKFVTGLGCDYSTCHLLDYPNFKESYNIIAIDSSKKSTT